MNLQDYVFVDKIPGVKLRAKTNKQVSDLLLRLRDQEHGVTLNDHTRMFKNYDNCFSALALVTWLCTYLNVERPVAVRIGLYLQKMGHIDHITQDHLLKDKKIYFQFIGDPIQRAPRPKSLSARLFRRSATVSRSSTRNPMAVSLNDMDSMSTVHARTDSKLLIPMLSLPTQEPEVDVTAPSPRIIGDPVLDGLWIKSNLSLQVEEAPKEDTIEIVIEDIRVSDIMPLPKESCGGPGGSIITKGDTNPYCKIIINDFVHTTEVRRNITNPMWDNAITIKVADFPIKVTIVVLDFDKAITAGNDLIGYFSITMQDFGHFVINEKLSSLHNTKNGTIRSQIKLSELGSTSC